MGFLHLNMVGRWLATSKRARLHRFDLFLVIRGQYKKYKFLLVYERLLQLLSHV